ncbi:MAG: hypothetical protein GC181_07125 [Bacteroidetes bacterium]|nr:hypothetical protein [Bacteroidota bacterium]
MKIQLLIKIIPICFLCFFAANAIDQWWFALDPIGYQHANGVFICFTPRLYAWFYSILFTVISSLIITAFFKKKIGYLFLKWLLIICSGVMVWHALPKLNGLWWGVYNSNDEMLNAIIIVLIASLLVWATWFWLKPEVKCEFNIYEAEKV